MRREDVKELKKDLAKLGFAVPGNGTNQFGPQTTKKVKEFQKYYGLKITGTFNKETEDKLKKILATPLQKWNKHNDTIQLKKDLAFLGRPVPGNGTSSYGNDTEKTVKKFQADNGLVVNGIADEVTLKKIQELITAPLSNGMRREDVKELKKDLAKLGFAVPGSGTNQFGPQTTKKVKEFQKYYGLKITGTFNKETEDKLNKILATPLQKWNKHNDTIQLKKDLAFLGRPVPGNGTSSYGNDTEKTVKKFQADNGLVVNGIADEVTLKKIQELITAPLSNGMRREDVKELKKDLAKLGFAVPGNGTSQFGPQTRKKVKEFQKYYGLSQTGTVNQSTKKKLNEQVNSPLQKGKRHNDTLQIKRDINKIGFGGITVTTLFSDFTEKRVKELQKYYGLKVTGIADEVTRSKIKSIVNSPFQNGKRHNDTLKLKRNLNKIGFGGITVTTLFSDFTEKRVKEFQKHYGLVVNGIADEVTFAKINSVAAQSSKIVFLDAGHGGSDPGASGNGLREKDLTLDIAKRTKKQLEAAGFTVIMSRTTDKFPELSERTEHANRSKADIFVSIHINSGGGTGIETWKMAKGPKPSESNKLATHIQNETIKQTKMRDRGVKDGNLHVNRESNMPSALVEVGFIDTVADANKLKQTSFKNKAAKGIANGIKKYFNLT